MILMAVLLIGIAAVINSLPLAFFGMLFLGNLGVNLSFLACLPGALALKITTTHIVDTNNNKNK